MNDDIHIFVDADACPVKDETYKVAYRTNVRVTIVSNSHFRIPDHPLIDRVVVSDKFDAADDYIVQLACPRSIVVTSDILLAERCLGLGAQVLASNGKPFTENSIGGAVATRAIMADLRAGMSHENIGGPKAFTKADRSQYLSSLDKIITQMKKAH